MKRILSIILSITMLFSMGTVAFADGIDGPMQPAKIKVGINAQFPPFEYYDENGELYGFDIDLMNYIGKRIGFEIEYVDMSFDKLIPAVMSGEVACAISAISITEERNNVIDYTIPYLSAKVTYFDGETSDTSIEQYGIVFPDNSAEKGKVAEAAGEPETSVYNQVNNALSDLIEDMTIEKLGEKYNLNKAADTDGFDYEYTVMPVPDNFDKTNMDKSELTSDGTPLAPSSDWALSEVEKAEALNITEKGEAYRYRMSITREEFCELIYNFYNNLANDRIVACDQNPFTDTDNKHITSLNEMSIIYGKSETEFAPDDLLTREEAATILFRIYLDFKPETKLNKRPAVGVFLDDESISDWAYTGVYIMASDGIEVMVGDGNNLNYHPKRTLTTQEAIVALVRLYDRTINPETGNIIIKNAEDLSYGQIKELQLIVDGGHYPWRLDYEEVLKNFLNDRGINVEDGKITELAGGGSSSGISLTYSVQEKEYVIELFQPIDTGEHGIWIVRTCEER